MSRLRRPSAFVATHLGLGLVAVMMVGVGVVGIAPDRAGRLPVSVRGVPVVAKPSASCTVGYSRHMFGDEPTPATRARVLKATTGADGLVGDEWNRPARLPARGIQIDHVRSLRSAWCYGASKWTPELRHSFASDPGNLVPTSVHLNESKRDLDPAAWQPPSPSSLCIYGLSWLSVTKVHGLPATRADLLAVARDIATCHG